MTQTGKTKPVHLQWPDIYVPRCAHPDSAEIDTDKVHLTSDRRLVTCKRCHRLIAKEQGQ